MTYRESSALGALQSSHPVRSHSHLAASIFGLGVAALFAWWAFADESLKIGVGVVLMMGLSFGAFREWLRIRAMVLEVRESGIALLGTGGQRVQLRFDGIRRLEARYVPGVLKKGLADEGNRVSLHVFDDESHISLPREMEGFVDLGTLLAKKTGLVERRVLIETVDAR